LGGRLSSSLQAGSDAPPAYCPADTLAPADAADCTKQVLASAARMAACSAALGRMAAGAPAAAVAFGDAALEDSGGAGGGDLSLLVGASEKDPAATGCGVGGGLGVRLLLRDACRWLDSCSRRERTFSAGGSLWGFAGGRLALVPPPPGCTRDAGTRSGGGARADAFLVGGALGGVWSGPEFHLAAPPAGGWPTRCCWLLALVAS
jgi:hypothetical protein